MRDVKHTAMALMAHCLEYYIYEYKILESTRFHVHSIIFPACALALCYVLSPDIMIIFSAGYMLLCSKLTEHVQYFEFLLMYPFVWSIVHNVNIPASDYLPILSVKHASYALQQLTPRGIHTKISATLCGGLYIVYDRLLKLNNDTFKPDPPYAVLVLNVVIDACFVSMWEPYDASRSSLVDAIACFIVVAVYKIPMPIYVKMIVNGVTYFVDYASFLPPLHYTGSINRCVTLSIKEELYDVYRVESHVRYLEHFMGFIVGYLILCLDSVAARLCSVAVMCASMCLIKRINTANEKQECRCAQQTPVNAV